jgi:hypothetical protein
MSLCCKYVQLVLRNSISFPTNHERGRLPPGSRSWLPPRRLRLRLLRAGERPRSGVNIVTHCLASGPLREDAHACARHARSLRSAAAAAAAPHPTLRHPRPRRTQRAVEDCVDRARRSLGAGDEGGERLGGMLRVDPPVSADRRLRVAAVHREHCGTRRGDRAEPPPRVAYLRAPTLRRLALGPRIRSRRRMAEEHLNRVETRGVRAHR